MQRERERGQSVLDRCEAESDPATSSGHGLSEKLVGDTSKGEAAQGSADQRRASYQGALLLPEFSDEEA